MSDGDVKPAPTAGVKSRVWKDGSVDGTAKPEAPVKQLRQSRDERQFNKDTEKSLRESVSEATTDASSTITSIHDAQNGETEYQPPVEEDGDDDDEYFSGSASASDSDFSESAPPAKKARAAAPTKKSSTPTATKGQRKKVAETKRDDASAKKLQENGSENKKVSSVKNRSVFAVERPASASLIQSPVSSTTALVSDRVASKQTTPGLVARRMPPKWTPPGPASRENCKRDSNLVTSRGTPLIRLGLSRRARVKPLHDSPKIG